MKISAIDISRLAVPIRRPIRTSVHDFTHVHTVFVRLRTDAGFRRMLAGTAIKRVGRDRFVRNALIGLGNSGDAALAPAAEARLGDASPLVRAMAVWALSQLLDEDRFATLREAHMPGEPDADVRAEWQAPL